MRINHLSYLSYMLVLLLVAGARKQLRPMWHGPILIIFIGLSASQPAQNTLGTSCPAVLPFTLPGNARYVGQSYLIAQCFFFWFVIFVDSGARI
jgi:hypothetical protein